MLDGPACSQEQRRRLCCHTLQERGIKTVAAVRRKEQFEEMKAEGCGCALSPCSMIMQPTVCALLCVLLL